jgi:hypothetical protein
MHLFIKLTHTVIFLARIHLHPRHPVRDCRIDAEWRCCTRRNFVACADDESQLILIIIRYTFIHTLHSIIGSYPNFMIVLLFDFAEGLQITIVTCTNRLKVTRGEPFKLNPCIWLEDQKYDKIPKPRSGSYSGVYTRKCELTLCCRAVEATKPICILVKGARSAAEEL